MRVNRIEQPGKAFVLPLEKGTRVPRGSHFAAPVLLAIGLALLFCFGTAGAAEFSRYGADSCVLCHGETSERPATAIFATPHGARSDPDAPFAQLQCETCHGPSETHARAARHGEWASPAEVFGAGKNTPVSEQNQVCIGCHETRGRLGWEGSRHQSAGVACASCHQIHRPRDRVFDSLAQQEACFACHSKRRADTFKVSSHPLRFGEMSCSSCHDPHNGNNDFLLRASSVNETCYLCHAEKRGPFLWEHAPSSEDCSICHRPHGSNHPALLSKRPPLLCQQCHAAEGHPSVAYGSDDVGNQFNNRFLLSRACLNCHSQIHGSNHPSGATLHR